MPSPVPVGKITYRKYIENQAGSGVANTAVVVAWCLPGEVFSAKNTQEEGAGEVAAIGEDDRCTISGVWCEYLTCWVGLVAVVPSMTSVRLGGRLHGVRYPGYRNH